MKFYNGMWMTQAGYNVQTPKELYTSSSDEYGLTLYYPFVKVFHRGNTLDGGMLTVRVTSPAEDVVSVNISHFKGSRAKKPAFVLEHGSVKPQIREEEDAWVLTTGKLEVRAGKGDKFGLWYSYDGKPLTSTSGKAMASIEGPDGRNFIRESLELDVGENIYGLGERFGALVKNGQTVDIWNADGGTDSEQSYKNIPFFLSSKGYGVLVNSTAKVSFEVGSELVTKNQFSVPGEEMEYLLFGGKTPKEALSTYGKMAGAAPHLPVWSFGLWLSTSFTTKYDEATVLHFIDGMLERDIPLSVFHFDCFWMKEYEWCNFIWDADVFPDPEGLIRKIHDRGIKVCVWINPYIGQKSPMFKEGYENNYFVNTGSGDVWQWDRWQAGMALVDFTNPEAKAWYQKKLEALVDMGVDSFKTDFGERIPVKDSFYGVKAATEGISYHSGEDAEWMHNWYTYLYNEAVFEVLEKKRGKGQACLFARSATVGGNKFPLHWGGDNLSNYPSMAESLRGGLSFGLSGFTYWSHDIGGFEAGCNPDIYKRWTQFGLLSSHSRYHGNQEYKVPWEYGEEAVEVTRAFSKLKNRLVPYLYSQGVENGEKALPMLRAMMLEFPEDPGCAYLDGQYMLGDSLLVAPILNTEGTAKYYVPAGEWVNILTDETVTGPAWRCEQHGYLTLPLLARPGSIVAMGVEEGKPVDAFGQKLELHIFNLADGETAQAILRGENGQRAVVKAQRSGADVAVTTEGDAIQAVAIVHEGVDTREIAL